MPTPPEQCIDALHEAALRVGESPSKAEYESLGLQPASATIIRQIGGWNRAKKQAHLPTEPSTGSRIGERPADVDVSAAEWQAMSVDQRWHYRNVEENGRRTKRRRARLRQWTNEWKAHQGCESCGIDDPACLDFHHLQPDEKERAVGKLITHGYGKNRLREEMARCEVICANCHRREHNSPVTTEARETVLAFKAARGCRRCDEQDPVCLDCHHDGEKGSTVARLLANDRPRNEVMAEVRKCTILCANCHRREHFEPPLKGQ